MTSDRPAERPTVAIVGAGSVGCHLGGLLAGAAQVVLVGRPRVIDAIREHGLTVSRSDHPDLTVPATRLGAGTDPSAVTGARFVLVTTKSADTREAARSISTHLDPGATVVSLQNGLRNADTLRQVFAEAIPDEERRPVVLSGVVGYNVAQTGPATFHQGTSGGLVVEAHPQAAPLRDVLEAAGIEVLLDPEISRRQHGKLLLNLNNAINALSGLPLRDQLSDRSYRRCLALCHDEAVAVLRAAGIRPTSPTKLPTRLVPHVLRAPTPVFRALAGPALRVDPTARSSMADDLARGRRTEIAELQGAVVALGAQLGIPTPASERIVALVRAAEDAGPQRRPWGGPELWRHLTDR